MKFRRLQYVLTLTRLVNLQNYINTRVELGEINEDQNKQMKPVAEQNGRVHGLPKNHKSYTALPKLCPTIDNITHFIVTLVNSSLIYLHF